ncbi:MAG: hypothetical protein V3S41_06035 [Spirochaetia bacterium]
MAEIPGSSGRETKIGKKRELVKRAADVLVIGDFVAWPLLKLIDHRQDPRIGAGLFRN